MSKDETSPRYIRSASRSSARVSSGRDTPFAARNCAGTAAATDFGGA